MCIYIINDMWMAGTTNILPATTYYALLRVQGHLHTYHQVIIIAIIIITMSATTIIITLDITINGMIIVLMNMIAWMLLPIALGLTV